jgi:hypothetical protein
MAIHRNNLKRYWPIMLLAIAVAERAHAPLIDGALAALKQGRPARTSPTGRQLPPGPAKKPKPDLHAPTAPDQPDPTEVLKKLKELEPYNPKDPWNDWILEPGSSDPAAPGQGSQPIGLLQPGSPDPLAGISESNLPDSGDGFDGGGGGSDGGTVGSPPGNTGSTGFGGDGGLDAGSGTGGGSAPDAPDQPKLRTTEIAAVPEPGMISVLLTGWVLLGRRNTRRRK